MTKNKKRPLEAFVWWNGGCCHVLACRDNARVATSQSFRRATRKARKRGYAVRVYKGAYAKAPRDAIDVRDGSYVLPSVQP